MWSYFLGVDFANVNLGLRSTLHVAWALHIVGSSTDGGYTAATPTHETRPLQQNKQKTKPRTLALLVPMSASTFCNFYGYPIPGLCNYPSLALGNTTSADECYGLVLKRGKYNGTGSREGLCWQQGEPSLIWRHLMDGMCYCQSAESAPIACGMAGSMDNDPAFDRYLCSSHAPPPLGPSPPAPPPSPPPWFWQSPPPPSPSTPPAPPPTPPSRPPPMPPSPVLPPKMCNKSLTFFIENRGAISWQDVQIIEWSMLPTTINGRPAWTGLHTCRVGSCAVAAMGERVTLSWAASDPIVTLTILQGPSQSPALGWIIRIDATQALVGGAARDNTNPDPAPDPTDPCPSDDEFSGNMYGRSWYWSTFNGGVVIPPTATDISWDIGTWTGAARVLEWAAQCDTSVSYFNVSSMTTTQYVSPTPRSRYVSPHQSERDPTPRSSVMRRWNDQA